MKTIGILIGREWSWPPAFIEEVNRRSAGVAAELVKLGGSRMADMSEYDVIVDRISQEVPYYRIVLKTVVLAGSTVINNPFWLCADDRFFAASLVTRLNIQHPRSVALPSHSYNEEVQDKDALSNLIYPIPWEDHINYLGGFPVMLRPISERSFKKIYRIESIEELWRSYNETGTECMMLQEHIVWDKYIRCICIGQEHVMPIRYDPEGPWSSRYLDVDDYLTDDEREQVVDSTLKISRAIGYDMNAVDFGIKDDMLYVTNPTNPVPDFDVNSITPHYFDWVVKTMVDFSIGIAKGRRQQLRDFSWSKLINSSQRASTTSKTVSADKALPDEDVDSVKEKKSSRSSTTRTRKKAPAPEE